MSTTDLLHPIYHLGKLNVSENVPLTVLEELFVIKGMKKGTFSIFSLVNSKKETITVFDYPVEMKQDEYKTLMSTVQKELDIFSKYYSEAEILNIIKDINKK